ncbi:LacI family DNA-binding transcriptional regulator [Mameliella sediminis]|uniref:LacI family DNA-binding transcriptional regulator n=1 Tax=Mameliella sediminis TaxID=2836866 RepID=UPI001C497658|nr:LacI family DNA-binding transcriptional regulator [Mameliella sediminis]MBV7396417.1 LacI family transcriptional regulator [Mameliella sediminis]MBY6162744.1 LacI family transcriptional regulator [Mameliella alba]MBY6171007.1 LacI family transcriptional regulator [Mameliella alba]MBY6176231.1 LacI family transcriptional regulator [Mameliella alba]
MAGKRIKNMEEFAEVSGISRPTLSKYFQDPESVRKTTRAKVESALEQFDYRPNIFAINQNRKLTKTIGILVPYLADPFFAEMVRLIERKCIEAGYWPIVFSAHGDRELENNALATLESLRPAGALIAPLGRGSDLDVVRRFADEVPTVVFDSNVKVGKAFVGSNNFQSIPLIVDYLCRSGEPPCFFEMPPVNPNANKRREAYVQAMERFGHEPMIVQAKGGGWDFEQIGLEEGSRLISQRALPTNTVLCTNDRLAIGLITAAYQNGWRVGRGEGCALRVAGHDDHPWSRYTCPPLTTVSQDYKSIAEHSLQTLFAVLEGRSDELGAERPEYLFEGKLVLRSSA